MFGSKLFTSDKELQAVTVLSLCRLSDTWLFHFAILMIFTFLNVSRFPRRPLKSLYETFKISVDILKSYLLGIIYFCFDVLLLFPSVSVFQTACFALADLAPRWGPLNAFHLCCKISREAESRWMPCSSLQHVSKHLTKKVSIIFFLSVDKDSETEREQMASLTYQGNQWHS